MIFILTIVVSIVIMAFYMNPTNMVLKQELDQAKLIADQMIIYHSAAAQVCSISCPNGSIDPTPKLSAIRQNKGPFVQDGIFRSRATDAMVFTYYVRSDDDADARLELNGRVLSEIIGARRQDTGYWVGAFNASTETLKTRGNPISTVPGRELPVLSFAGSGIPDGSPVIFNRK